MSEEHTHQRLLVDIDALFDTRMGTLSLMDPELIKTAVVNGYEKRPSDEMGKLLGDDSLTEVFKERYKNRDINTLKASVCSNIIFTIRELTGYWDRLLNETTMVESITVEINTYPYDMSQSDKESLEAAVLYYASAYSNIKAVNIPTEKITVSLLKERYSGMIVYDIDNWLQYHLDEFKTIKMPDVSIITPALYHNKVPTEAELAQNEIKELDAFGALKLAFAEFVTLEFVPVKDFCVLKIPPKKKSKGTSETSEKSSTA